MSLNMALLVVLVGLSLASAATAFQPTQQNDEHEPALSRVQPARGTAHPAMAYIPGATFRMGFDHAHDDERPVHAVTVRPFLLDLHEVTNREFAQFVEATGYITQAERDGDAWCFLEGARDFHAITGADWRHPEGTGSSIESRLAHPVVCVSWDDAAAYAEWAGKRLPTEAEWEYAARGGRSQHFIADVVPPSPIQQTPPNKSTPSNLPSPAGPVDPEPGSEGLSKTASGEVRVTANVWQGVWPHTNELTDGFFYTAPAGRFKPNALGVYDMVGNVWEWTADWYDAAYYQSSPAENPTGPPTGQTRVARGGSWFCSPNYCGAYSTHYRGSSPPDHAFNNVGFRCAMDLPDGFKLPKGEKQGVQP